MLLINTCSSKYTTSVCYNTLSPTWEQCSISFEGTLKDILSQVVVFRVYHNNAVLELLGECKVSGPLW
jgi:hypothetical protein